MNFHKFRGTIKMGLFGCCDSLYKEQVNYEIVKENPSKQEIIERKKDDLLPYKSKFLLTKTEWAFYKRLKNSADKFNLHILAKVRLADLVQVDSYFNGMAFEKYFAKIKAKHVDFVLCNPDNLAVKFILELEDSTHYSAQRAERDDFVDKVLKKCGYKIVHTYGEANLDELIQRLLK